MKSLQAAAVAAVLVGATATPVLAQTYTQRDRVYTESRTEYERQVREYEAARSRYEADRAAYDRQYGAGAYERYYGPPPVYERYYSDRYDSRYDDRYGDRYDDRYDNRYDDRYDDRYSAYDPYYGDGRYYGNRAPYDSGYGGYSSYNRFINSDCERRYNTNSSGNRTGGTLLGALIGGALGAAAAGDSSETEGAVLGAVVGGALGNSIAGNSSTVTRYAPRCDATGYYYSYDQTVPYRENTRYRNGRYDYSYYSRQRCRLAVAPDDRYGRVDYRYVRVCPDRNNRYRITA